MILGSDGNLYGTTDAGGTYNQGNVFRLSPTRPHTSTVLYSFQFILGDGIHPLAGLLLAQDGNYYGTTASEGGTSVGGGYIFQITPSGQLTYLHQFSNNEVPDAALIQAKDGTFYGTTNSRVFKMTATFDVITLHLFGVGASRKTDASGYLGVVIGPNGNLYGASAGGGRLKGGTIFELGTDGSNYILLHHFGYGSKTPNDGVDPNGPLVLGSDNNFYGTTQAGGSTNLGTVFKFSP